MTRKDFGKIVRELREKEGLSQKKLGKLLGWGTGQYVSNIERGACNFPYAKIHKFCKALHIDKKEFIDHQMEVIREQLERSS